LPVNANIAATDLKPQQTTTVNAFTESKAQQAQNQNYGLESASSLQFLSYLSSTVNKETKEKMQQATSTR